MNESAVIDISQAIIEAVVDAVEECDEKDVSVTNEDVCMSFCVAFQAITLAHLEDKLALEVTGATERVMGGDEHHES